MTGMRVPADDDASSEPGEPRTPWWGVIPLTIIPGTPVVAPGVPAGARLPDSVRRVLGAEAVPATGGC